MDISETKFFGFSGQMKKKVSTFRWNDRAALKIHPLKQFLNVILSLNGSFPGTNNKQCASTYEKQSFEVSSKSINFRSFQLCILTDINTIIIFFNSKKSVSEILNRTVSKSCFARPSEEKTTLVRGWDTYDLYKAYIVRWLTRKILFYVSEAEENSFLNVAVRDDLTRQVVVDMRVRRTCSPIGGERAHARN